MRNGPNWDVGIVADEAWGLKRTSPLESERTEFSGKTGICYHVLNRGNGRAEVFCA